MNVGDPLRKINPLKRIKHSISEQFNDPEYLARRKVGFLEHLEEVETPWNRTARQCLHARHAAQFLNDAELSFLVQMKRANWEPSGKQRWWLARIAAKCGVGR